MNINRVTSYKKKLINSLDKLSEGDMQELLDFAEFIVSRRYRTEKLSHKRKLVPESDPILKLMGIADIAPFADKIDNELYGI